jgi:hypothetical protein
MKYWFSFVLSTVLAVIFSGCANHVRYDYQNQSRIDRSKVNEECFITIKPHGNSAEVIELEVTKQCKFKVVQYEDVVKKELYTPYSGLRKLYEVPAGFGLLPAAIVINALDFATLGLIPNSATDGTLDMAFAGMNPFMNWESEDRSELKDVETKSNIIDRRFETSRIAAPIEKVFVYGQGKLLMTLSTDSRGQVVVNLLDRDFVRDKFGVRELLFKVGSDNGTIQKTYIIGRQQLLQMKRARRMIIDYRRKPSPAGLAEIIMQLERMNFKKTALLLEREQLKKKDAKFVIAFEAACEKKLAALSSPILKKNEKQ